MSSKQTFRVLSLTIAVFFGPQALGQGQDPGDPGPLAATVQRVEYNLGDTAFTPPGFPGPVELNAVVYYPDLSQGPFPLIVFLHGRHATCYSGTTAFLEWPCAAGHASIPSYRGYEYIQSVLAGYGFIVASIGSNGINARDNSVTDLGALARAQLIQKHLDLWFDWNNAGAPPFGTLFRNQVDLSNVGTMGHSRGGEGVAMHYVYNRSLGSPYGVTAVLPLAPVDFNRPDVTNVALEVMLPYCDGDVSDLQGIHFVDDVRYTSGDLFPKYATLVMGANHNFFNTIWTPGGWPAGTADDWVSFVGGGASDAWCGTVPGNHRLTPEQQRGTGKAYINGFFLHVAYRSVGPSIYDGLWKGDASPPPSAMTMEIHQSYLPGDDPSMRLDINRLLSASDLTVNAQGGAVTMFELVPYDVCGGAGEPTPCLPGQSNARQPHTTPSARSARPGLSQNRFGWNNYAFLTNNLPGVNVSRLSALQFRAALNYNDPRNNDCTSKDFLVNLTDGSGHAANIRLWDTLSLPPGDVASTRPIPKVFLNTVRMPLFLFPGVDLTNIQSVSFSFTIDQAGALLMSDLQFAD